ncbi:uncharacterized protein LOC120206699 [Hibiscus syriacus]|uniref:uncharacterized protein LOC120206699 n=1 Tax=Hibiscus syriacus TaxID=106335 RepID=UPI001921E1CA|nr:uncharacterized protein LOC120206699 [Hibiscus syriacus]
MFLYTFIGLTNGMNPTGGNSVMQNHTFGMLQTKYMLFQELWLSLSPLIKSQHLFRPKPNQVDHNLPLCRSILRIYAHDDVSAGSWFIGLDVKHVDESKFCCSPSSTGSICATV